MIYYFVWFRLVKKIASVCESIGIFFLKIAMLVLVILNKCDNLIVKDS